ncbi:DNA primase, partial [Candidatus Peregrinibacteria bacterium]|nr:DNA primase [Candidatus Peregrinibacteria bacterium]
REYRTESSQRSEISKSEKDILYNAHEAAAEYFSKNLWDTGDGKKVLKYLKNRGLSDAIIREHGLGFAPDNKAEGLINYLIEKGFQKSAIIKSGLVVSKDVGSEDIADKFRMRLMFPISDSQGRIIAFGGRAMKDGQEPKYLNSPETDIYHKSSVLYGLHFAKKFIKEQDAVLVVEGYMDALACYQADIKNVVASSGTALTLEHARLIKRFTQNSIAAFDNDEAGQEASRRAFCVLQEQEVSVKMLKIPFGKDPADAVKKDPEKFKEAMKTAPQFFDNYVGEAGDRFNLKEDSGILSFLRECLNLLISIKNNVLQDIAVRNVANKLGVKESKIYDEIAKHKTNLAPATATAVQPEREQRTVRKLSAQNIILGMLIAYPELYAYVGDKISEADFENSSKLLYKTFIDQYNNIRASESGASQIMMEAMTDTEAREQTAFLNLYAETKYEHSKAEIIRKDFEQLLQHVVSERIARRKEGLTRRIRQLESEGNTEECRKLLAELQQLCVK